MRKESHKISLKTALVLGLTLAFLCIMGGCGCGTPNNGTTDTGDMAGTGTENNTNTGVLDQGGANGNDNNSLVDDLENNSINDTTPNPTGNENDGVLDDLGNAAGDVMDGIENGVDDITEPNAGTTTDFGTDNTTGTGNSTTGTGTGTTRSGHTNSGTRR